MDKLELVLDGAMAKAIEEWSEDVTKMTKVEEAWLQNYVEILAEFGQIRVIPGIHYYEPIMLRLPGGTKYTPDFMHIGVNQEIYLVETKASRFQKNYYYSLTRLKFAKTFFPMFHFLVATKKGGGQWELREIL